MGISLGKGRGREGVAGEEEGERKLWFRVLVSESLARSGKGVPQCLTQQALNEHTLNE